MKKLTRMKLINWHRFNNCTIEFGDSTLISGENGAGKSTLLDAIQFVILCSTNSFNKAAHENGKRKLTGYIRCKTGKENKPYERTGELSAHVALEFYEESRKKYFIIGAAVDSSSEGQETTARYLIENTQLEDSMFFKGRAPRSINEFRGANSNIIRQWCKTNSEARKMVTSRLGRIENKFFRLIPKALAFKPIDDIKDFVYSYVLDEKEVNIDVLRENVRTYQDLERTLESVKSRITKLEKINSHHDDVMDCIRRDNMYHYFLAHGHADLIQDEINRLKQEINRTSIRLEEEEKALKNLEYEKDQTQEMETNLRVELRENSDFRALEQQRKELSELENKQLENSGRFTELKKLIMDTVRRTESLIRLTAEESGAAANAVGAAAFAELSSNVPEEFIECFKKPEKLEDVSAAKQLSDELKGYKEKLYALSQRERAEQDIVLKDGQAKAQQLKVKIEDLKRSKLSYPEAVELLLDTIRQEFVRLGRKTEPHVLCELLEIEKEDWRNAVEGYLNTQRFHILVEPENYDIALGIYDKLRKAKKVYGAGLVNLAKLDEYADAPEGSLAEAVSSGNVYAARYVNMLLGKVHCCDRYEDLKKYPVSITRQCMRYQNHVAMAIKPEVFKVPFIGKNAFKVQLELAEKEYDELAARISEDKKRQARLDKIISIATPGSELQIKHDLDVITAIKETGLAIETRKKSIATLEKDATLIQKNLQLEMLSGIRKEQENSIAIKNQDIGSEKQRLEGLKAGCENKEIELSERRAEWQRLAEDAGDMLPVWEKEYERAGRGKDTARFIENYERQQKNNDTQKANALSRMIDVMITYKTEHDFGAAPSLDGYPEYAAVYDRLKTSELLEYEGKVQSARAAAEEEFREQFLSKLQENMKQAQSEFKELNRALKDIAFSNEKYEFLYMPSKAHRSYYEMIMDDFNAVQGESIFSGLFHEAHKEVIDELFDRLALNNENSAAALDLFTDYRTYMDYDIKIIHSDGSYSYYSKVCEEKSGGETQTPFYVTVAASFVQLYGNNIGGEAAGLVMFDEAFNNMDDERIGGVLEFLNRLPLQFIIAAPPDKIQYIGPSMAETLLVMTDEKSSFVEEYVQVG
ncbi:MAG: SbcC/MukB-like Walker B domain-containing protein [Eubacteriales bacterium]|nr:SbcC/MukB-like Walker B domain-containing protein [Eubacteriales bacterium]